MAIWLKIKVFLLKIKVCFYKINCLIGLIVFIIILVLHTLTINISHIYIIIFCGTVERTILVETMAPIANAITVLYPRFLRSFN